MKPPKNSKIINYIKTMSLRNPKQSSDQNSKHPENGETPQTSPAPTSHPTHLQGPCGQVLKNVGDSAFSGLPMFSAASLFSTQQSTLSSE